MSCILFCGSVFCFCIFRSSRRNPAEAHGGMVRPCGLTVVQAEVGISAWVVLGYETNADDSAALVSGGS